MSIIFQMNIQMYNTLELIPHNDTTVRLDHIIYSIACIIADVSN